MLKTTDFLPLYQVVLRDGQPPVALESNGDCKHRCTSIGAAKLAELLFLSGWHSVTNGKTIMTREEFIDSFCRRRYERMATRAA